MNKFAQILYGKVFYIEETNMTKDQLSTVFDPNTYWVDVTNMPCKIGDILVIENNKEVIKDPKEINSQASINHRDIQNAGIFQSNEKVGIDLTEQELEQAKKQKKLEIDEIIKDGIEQGFISHAVGPHIIFDSDKDTQVTIANAAAICDQEDFKKLYPDGYPIRGVREGFNEIGKEVFLLEPSQIKILAAELTYHITACKEEGWKRKEEIDKMETIKEVEDYKIYRINIQHKH